MTNFFASDEFFYKLFYVLPTIIVYVRIIFTFEYSYRHSFYKREHLVFSNLKIPLVYLFYFKSDLKMLKPNKIVSAQGKGLFFFNSIKVFR